MKRITRTVALPAALAATLFLSACGAADTKVTSGTNAGASPASSAPVSKTKNAADVAFASMMTTHHVQAVAMADLAVEQAKDPRVKALAQKIKAAQQGEIEQMSSWLAGWGAPVPGPDSGSDMAGMPGMSGDQSGGMVPPQQLADLGKATGSAFDRMWLQNMVEHHRGAVAMAQTMLAQGANPDAKKLARSVIAGQSAEIAEMSSILTSIPA